MPDDLPSRPQWPPVPPGTRQPAAARRFRRLWATLAISVAMGVAAIAVIGAVVLRPHWIRIEGGSMSPTLQDDDRALFLGLRDAPARGDVVAFRYPKNPAKSFAMRVVGLPGESLSIADGVISIDGRPIAEPYLSDASRTHETRGAIRLGADEYFVMGDRRNNASDSREWGPVPRHLIWARLHGVLVRPPH